MGLVACLMSVVLWSHARRQTAFTQDHSHIGGKHAKALFIAYTDTRWHPEHIYPSARLKASALEFLVVVRCWFRLEALGKPMGRSSGADLSSGVPRVLSAHCRDCRARPFITRCLLFEDRSRTGGMQPARGAQMPQRWTPRQRRQRPASSNRGAHLPPQTPKECWSRTEADLCPTANEPRPSRPADQCL